MMIRVGEPFPAIGSLHEKNCLLLLYAEDKKIEKVPTIIVIDRLLAHAGCPIGRALPMLKPAEYIFHLYNARFRYIALMPSNLPLVRDQKNFHGFVI